MGENQLRSAICFSRQKTQYIFSINTRHIIKAQTFFFHSIFPPKDLVYFSIKTNMKQYENVDFFL